MSARYDKTMPRAGLDPLPANAADRARDNLRGVWAWCGHVRTRWRDVGRAGSEVEARSLWLQNNTLRGVFLGGALLNEYPRVHAMIAELFEQVADGRLRVEIDRTFPLADAGAAHAYIESRQAFGRVVLVPSI